MSIDAAVIHVPVGFGFFFALMSPRGVFFLPLDGAKSKLNLDKNGATVFLLANLLINVKRSIWKKEKPESSSGKYFWLLYLITQQIVLTKHFYRTSGIPRGLIHTANQHWGLWLYVSFLLTAVLITYAHQISHVINITEATVWCGL